MTDQIDIEKKFWRAVNSDRTMMLGLDGAEDGHTRPMTAQLDPDYDKGDIKVGPIWFFTAKDTELVKAIAVGGRQSHRGVAHFVSKGHDLFASAHGLLTVSNDRQMIDRLWNSFVAAWYQGGKDDPKLQLLRFDPDAAQIWLNENSLLAGVKMLLGGDPKEGYKDKVAEVSLR